MPLIGGAIARYIARTVDQDAANARCAFFRQNTLPGLANDRAGRSDGDVADAALNNIDANCGAGDRSEQSQRQI